MPFPKKSHRETRKEDKQGILKHMCLAVYERYLSVEETSMSSVCFNRELQKYLHTCPSNHMHRHRGKTGSTFYWAKSQEGSVFCSRLFENFIKLHKDKNCVKIKTTNQFTKPTLALPDARWCHCQTSTTMGKEFPRDQSSGGWGTTQDKKSHSFPLFIPLNEPWSFGAPKASKQQVEIKLIHGEREVQAQHRLTQRLSYSHTGSTTASSHLTCSCVSSLFNLLFLETRWLTFLMKPGLVGSAPWHFFLQNRNGNLLEFLLLHSGKPATSAQDDSIATFLAPAAFLCEQGKPTLSFRETGYQVHSLLASFPLKNRYLKAIHGLRGSKVKRNL